jgi:hypothetical protein
MENSNENMGNRNRDLLASRPVPQPTASPRLLYRNLYILPFIKTKIWCMAAYFSFIRQCGFVIVTETEL